MSLVDNFIGMALVWALALGAVYAWMQDQPGDHHNPHVLSE